MSKGSGPKYILEESGEFCKSIPRASDETTTRQFQGSIPTFADTLLNESDGRDAKRITYR